MPNNCAPFQQHFDYFALPSLESIELVDWNAACSQKSELMQKHPDRVVEKAIVGMLPKNKLSRQIQRKLRVYAGPEHPHTAQQPVPYEIKQVAQ